MSKGKQTAVVICPGRGTYNKPELGVLGRQFSDKALLARFDRMRSAQGQESLTALDGAERYLVAKHTRGDNASALIYAATLGDFRTINPEKIDVVAVTGNSMGWYSALACAGALSAEGGFEVVNTMGTLMQDNMIGGQLVYPFLNADWHPDPARKAELLALVDQINGTGATLTLSIDLGGMLVLAGDEAGLAAFEKAVPVVQDRFPLRLANHAGFHSHLQTPVAVQGRAQLGADLFQQPSLPMIDGRGQIWWPGACDTNALWEYTLGHQVTETYNFTHAIAQAAREFAPDLFIVTGPGTTLGGAVAQSLILSNWDGLSDKASFQNRQREEPLLVSMGMDDQRALVT
ncbi:ACP S-malonyltransferase [Ruegeria sp. HKCCD4884]|uniref:ACP S-malonyltransferase n=1 Tax=Ruegeria sp. HKCCD4884 TaxID=2683022 RepID=UPI0014911704|nr:ACP S-malonyltransferase [Ruegeria sp. HKCCD4884]NOD92498.1 ACP S-malonyltransferase [Ruegeria sp. HKCCD4884]